MIKTTLLESDVFNADSFKTCIEATMDQLDEYLNWKGPKGVDFHDPAVLKRTAQELMAEDNGELIPFDDERFRKIVNLYLSTGLFVHTTGSLGRQYSGTIPLAAVTDMISSITNQPSSFYEASQLPCVAERIMAEELNRFIGFDEDKFTMFTTSGGSLANLTALLAARNDRYPDCWSKGLAACSTPGLPAIAMSEDAHYSLSRAVEVSGIGDGQIVHLPVDSKRRIDVEKVQPVLDEASNNGLDVFCLVASAGTTPVGAIDPLDELGDIARSNRLWYHVDGCHGASLLVSDKLRHLLKGIAKADSLSWDAHKLLFVPSPCSLLFYKDKRKAHHAFHQHASYVFPKEQDSLMEYDNGDKNFECTKRPMIMNLWTAWAIYGRALFSRKIELLCSLCRQAYQVLEDSPDFTALHFPEINILCFRYQPGNLPEGLSDSFFQQEIRKRICTAGTYFISKTDIDGKTALRTVIMHHKHTVENFRNLLEAIRVAGRGIIDEYIKLSN